MSGEIDYSPIQDLIERNVDVFRVVIKYQRPYLFVGFRNSGTGKADHR